MKPHEWLNMFTVCVEHHEHCSVFECLVCKKRWDVKVIGRRDDDNVITFDDQVLINEILPHVQLMHGDSASNAVH